MKQLEPLFIASAIGVTSILLLIIQYRLVLRIFKGRKGYWLLYIPILLTFWWLSVNQVGQYFELEEQILSIVQTPTFTPTVTATNTPQPTHTSFPTYTPYPTYTLIPISTPTTLEEILKNAAREYLTLLSENQINKAWEEYLHPEFIEKHQDKMTKEGYNQFWRDITIDIISLTLTNLNIDETYAVISVQAYFTYDGVKSKVNAEIDLTYVPETKKWLISDYSDDFHK